MSGPLGTQYDCFARKVACHKISVHAILNPIAADHKVRNHFIHWSLDFAFTFQRQEDFHRHKVRANDYAGLGLYNIPVQRQHEHWALCLPPHEVFDFSHSGSLTSPDS